MSDIRLSIVIVSYNTRELTDACLRSLLVQPMKSTEIIVVDNGSTDGSPTHIQTHFTHVSCISLPVNVGFSAANNKGMEIAKGEYVLLLNSDTEVSPDKIETMIDFFRAHPKAGAVTPKLLLPSGTIDPACHRGFPTPWAALTYFLGLEAAFPHSRFFARYHQGFSDMSVPHTVDVISGAFFLTRRDVIDRVGPLDERFFMYAEDIDWALRMKERGYEIWFNPQVSVIHKKKQSGRANTDRAIRRKTDQSFYDTMWQFYEKHYLRKYPFMVTWLVFVALRVKRLIVTGEFS